MSWLETSLISKWRIALSSFFERVSYGPGEFRVLLQGAQSRDDEIAAAVFQGDFYLLDKAFGCVHEAGQVVDADEGNKAVDLRIFQTLHFGCFHFNAFESPFGGIEPGDGLCAIVEFVFGTNVLVGKEVRPDVVGDNGIGIYGFSVVVEEAVNINECLRGDFSHDFDVGQVGGLRARFFTEGFTAVTETGVVVDKAKAIEGDPVGDVEGTLNSFLEFGLRFGMLETEGCSR